MANPHHDGRDDHGQGHSHDHPHFREDIRQVIFRPPHWIVRYGIGLCSFILAGLLLGSWLIRYPDLISGTVNINSTNPPVTLVAAQSGRMAHLMVADGEWVTLGQHLAVMESGAAYEDVSYLMQRLREQPNDAEDPVARLSVAWRQNLVLAELKPAYTLFLRHLREARDFERETYAQRKTQIFRDRIAEYQNLNDTIQRRLAIQRQEFQVSEKNYADHQKLRRGGHISSTVLAQVETSYLEKKAQVEEVEGQLFRNRIEISNLNQAIVEAEQTVDRRRRDLLNTLQQVRETLKAELLLWQKRYLFKAPMGGHVSLAQRWVGDQFVEEKQEILTVIPPEQSHMGWLELSAYGSGKVSLGQKVQIKLDSYPYKEFGVLVGEVSAFSPLKRKQGYLLQIVLPDGLVTNHHKRLPLMHNMEGLAEIITREMSLLERVFIQFRYLFTPV